jgi:UDP-2,3-diacylglucosamine hydrolase
LRVISAPANWAHIGFISDLHLGPDTPRLQRRLSDWLNGAEVDALFILGDLFEAWVGDDALALPYAQQLAATLKRSGLPIFFAHGNRDFLLGERMAAACGMQLLDELTVLDAFGERLLLAHGDAQCRSDTSYMAFRALVRSAAWQADFLKHPLEARLHAAAQMRDASRKAQGQATVYAEPDTALCREQLDAAGSRLMLHGHTHRPGRVDLGEGRARLVLSDWDEGRGDALIWSRRGWERVSTC